jgi:hypothetical protein
MGLSENAKAGCREIQYEPLKERTPTNSLPRRRVKVEPTCKLGSGERRTRIAKQQPAVAGQNGLSSKIRWADIFSRSIAETLA